MSIPAQLEAEGEQQHDTQRRAHHQAEDGVALPAALAARSLTEEHTRRSSFLARAGAELAGSPDAEVGMRKLLGLVVPQLADDACLLLRDEHGAADRVLGCRLANRAADEAGHAGNAQDGRDAEVSCDERRFDELSAHAQLAFCRCLETLAPVPLPPSGGPHHPDGPQAPAGVVVPLRAGNRMQGALIVEDPSRVLDTALIEELATRAALALDNACLHRRLEHETVQRRQAEARLHASNHRKDEFLAMLSHELRNPLAPIRNAVELIRRLAPRDPRLTRATDIVERQVTHLNRLVEQLLDAARIGKGKIALDMQPLDLRDVVRQAAQTAGPLIAARGHTLTLQLPEHAVRVRGDAGRLAQVVGHLLDNAARYTEAGGVIALSLTPPSERGEASITVIDNGIGIEPEVLCAVFDLFEQGPRTLDRSQGGLGVGLALVQRIVQLHDGRVQASSAGSGQGAQFQVHLPGASQDAELPDVEAESARATNGADTCRVLVVDDNHDAAQTLAAYLQLAGHHLRTEGDGAQALASAAIFAPDVVVLDIGLPGLDGYEVARRLRRLPQTAGSLLLALTGYDSQDDRLQAAQAGFDAHYAKPTDPALLALRIADWRQRSRTDEQRRAPHHPHAAPARFAHDAPGTHSGTAFAPDARPGSRTAPTATRPTP